MPTVAELWKNINSRLEDGRDGETGPAGAPGPFKGEFRFDEPLAAHTTFRVGGPADLWVRPRAEEFAALAALLLEAAGEAEIPVYVLGAGANLVVADRGIRGVTLDTTALTGLVPPPNQGAGSAEEGPAGNDPGGNVLRFRAGTAADDAAEEAARRGLGGLDFLAGMPGTLGGALWMNARCYGGEMADAAVEAVYLERPPGPRTPESPAAARRILKLRKEDFGYKTSPFQGREGIILEAAFALRKSDPPLIRETMAAHRRDREEKGQYRFPSAGSVFKNNRAFGKPAGKIIDELGLRGLSAGDAQVAPWHGNIIINRGKARAADIKALTETLEERVFAALGLKLEREVLFAGDWTGPGD
ncbi:MAG: UDP-N-acetylmuramate dehydrogenase [Treponema sp.]|nr:UDP-N-acetylmuramate dehydrogenase [Treponema sp.]